MAINYLVSLQENMPTYGANGDKVTGHVTIKSPGLIKCYIQNIKKIKNDSKYIFCVMSKQKNRGVKIGEVGVEKENRWLVNQNNINGSGLRLEDIDGVAVVMDDKDKEPETVLLGFVKDRYQVYHIIEQLFPRQTELKLTPITNKEKKEFTENINNIMQKEINAEFKEEVVKDSKPMTLELKDNEEEIEINKTKDEMLNKLTEIIEDSIAEEKDYDNDRKNEDNNTELDKVKYQEVKNIGGFVVPKDANVISAEVGFEEKAIREDTPKISINEEGIDKELQRIIDIISKDGRVERKVKELQDEIYRLRHVDNDNISSDKECNEQTNRDRQESIKDDSEQIYKEDNNDEFEINKKQPSELDEIDCYNEYNKDKKDACVTCTMYTANKLNIEEATEENEVTDSDPSSPQDALSYIENMENVPEEDDINEKDEELEYLRKMDIKLKEVRSKINQGIQNLNNN